MNPGRAFAGFAAMAVPLGLTIFALVSGIIIGWRNWFGIQKKPPPKPDAKPRRKPPVADKERQ